MKRSVTLTNDGYMMLLDAIYFNGTRLGNIAAEGITWGGDDAQIYKLWAAQQRAVPVKNLKTRDAANDITGKIIQLIPENCKTVMGGKVTGDKWEAPAQALILEGAVKILAGTGQTIEIKRATLLANVRGGLGGENTLGIEFTLSILAPYDGSSPFSIYPTVPAIAADPASLTFGKAGGSQTVDIEASGPFSVGAVPEGFSVKVVDGRVTVTAEENDSGGERSGNLEFILEADTSVKATVALSQSNA